MSENPRPEEQAPIEYSPFWVRFYTGKVAQGEISEADPNPFLETRIRIMDDFIEATTSAQMVTTGGEISLHAFFDGQNKEVTDHDSLMSELMRRQRVFSRTASPQDWQNRKMAREIESILDLTYLPSPNLVDRLRGSGIAISETTPADFARRMKSESLELIVGRVQKILSETPTTSSFQEYFIDLLRMAYLWGIPARNFINLPALGLDLDKNSFDIFDSNKTKDIERKAFEERLETARGFSSPDFRQEFDQKNVRWRSEFAQLYGEEP